MKQSENPSVTGSAYFQLLLCLLLQLLDPLDLPEDATSRFRLLLEPMA